MEDALLKFGSITLGKAGSEGAAGTPGYSEHCIDFKVDKEDLSNLNPCMLVIIADGAVTAAQISLYSGASDNPTTSIKDYPAIASMADGDRVEMELPFTCSRYLRVGGVGTGKVIAQIEMGGKSAV